jgi:ribosomal protein S18 acetylase RimI-like enzyme
MLVRDAVPRDAEAIQRVAKRSVTMAYDGVVEDPAIIENLRRPGFIDDLRAWIEEVASRDCYIYLVAEDGDRVAGFAQYIWDPGGTGPFVGEDECLLHSLYVDPDDWRRGVGTHLTEGGLTYLPDDRTVLRLGVLKGNEDAVSFYEARGFERTGETTYHVSGGAYDCFVYSRPFATSE